MAERKMEILIMLTGMSPTIPGLLFAMLYMTNMILAYSLIAAILAGRILRTAFHVHRFSVSLLPVWSLPWLQS